VCITNSWGSEALTAPTIMAPACRWRSRPQHQLPTSGEPLLAAAVEPRTHRAWVTAHARYRCTGVGCSGSKLCIEFLADRNDWATPEAIFGRSARHERLHRSTGGAASRHCGCSRRAWRRAARHCRARPRRSCVRHHSGAWPGSAAPRAWSPCLRIGTPL